MKIKYYGTSAGGGIPEIFCSCRVCQHAREQGGKNIRTRSQAIIDGSLSIDYPVDTFLHTAYGGLDMRRIHHVLITHGHHDHFLMDDIFSRPQGIDEPICFYCSEPTGKGLKARAEAIEEAYRTGKRKRTSNFSVKVEYLQMYVPKDIMDYRVTPLRARHAEAIESMIFMIQSQGKNVLWGHDTGKPHDDAMEYIKNSGVVFDFVSLDCTLKRGDQITKSHMDLDWCIETAEELRRCGNIGNHTKIVLSHIGHLVERTHEELEAEAKEYGMEVAFDGMTIEI